MYKTRVHALDGHFVCRSEESSADRLGCNLASRHGLPRASVEPPGRTRHASFRVAPQLGMDFGWSSVSGVYGLSGIWRSLYQRTIPSLVCLTGDPRQCPWGSMPAIALLVVEIGPFRKFIGCRDFCEGLHVQTEGLSLRSGMNRRDPGRSKAAWTSIGLESGARTAAPPARVHRTQQKISGESTFDCSLCSGIE